MIQRNQQNRSRLTAAGGVVLSCLMMLFFVPFPAQAQVSWTMPVIEGCDVNFMNVQHDLAQLDLARYAALIEGLQGEPPPSLGQAACLQQMLGHSSKAGMIFSDALTFGSFLSGTATSAVGSAVSELVGTSADQWMGCNFQTSTLVTNLATSVTAGLTNRMTNLLGSFPGIGLVTSVLNNLNYACTVVHDLWNEVVNQLSATLGVDALTLCMIQNGAFGSTASPIMMDILTGAYVNDAVARLNSRLNAAAPYLGSVRQPVTMVPVGNTDRPSLSNFRAGLCLGATPGGGCPAQPAPLIVPPPVVPPLP